MDFFDTNILVYTVDPRDPHRRSVAREVLRAAVDGERLVLSVQVMQEFYNVVMGKRLLPHANAVAALREWSRTAPVAPTTPELLWHALELRERWQFSVWDALVVQAALHAGCSRLVTEDLHHGLRIGALEVFNPFLPGHAVHEPRPRYGARKKTAKA
ncbi:PIN domain-containing protein [Ramlibacter albus]|uniref:Ribonuclease VapC n=1 Tax=Ramlibacter albus TaxID=2079448 RepID=A0A923MDZ2_9BURK|nr:PIN domain-containing protein [Ramlibacter albus]MBC5767713.1 PIN domain-containing protein [Ramlibacter albus]